MFSRVQLQKTSSAPKKAVEPKATREHSSTEQPPENLPRFSYSLAGIRIFARGEKQQLFGVLGQPLDAATRAFMEPRFAHDFSKVRVHTDAKAHEYTNRLNADAVTLGLDVYFGRGLYRPDSAQGQALIAHELGHIAKSGAQGPAVPKLQGKTDPDHWKALISILEDKKAGAKAFNDYLKANPDSLPKAHTALVVEMVKVPAVRPVAAKLLSSFLKDHPEDREDSEVRLRAETTEQRANATRDVHAMWNEYKDAAYLYAVKQTYTDRADKERRKGGKPSPTTRELEYRRRIEYVDNRLKGKPKYKDRIAKANTAVKQLMEVSGSLATAQADFLKGLNDDIQADIHEANLTRLDSYYDFSYSKPKVAQRAEEAQKQLADARSANKAAETRRVQLESAPAGETPAHKRDRLSELQKAKQTQIKSKRVEQSATQIIHEPDIDEYLVHKERQAKPETKQRKEEEKKMRDARLRGQFLMPQNAGDDEAERWDIYYRAQENIERGFPGYAMEHTISVVLDARSLIADREATGIKDAEKIDTYLSHGEGQYDIEAKAGKEVAAALPNTVDLSNVFGRPADPAYGRPARIFTRTESFALPGSKGSADADVLNKLDWGFFGRGWTPAQKKGFLEGNDQNLPARDPMPERLLGGLLFEDTVADSSLSKPVEEARTQVRQEIEEAIRADLTSQGISIDENEPVLSSVKASSGSFGRRNMINQNAFGHAINPRTQKAFSKDQIVDLVMKSARQAILQDENLISDVQQLMSVIRANIKAGDLGGPTIQVVHKFVEHDDKNKDQVKEQVWIAVNYIHLRQTAPDLKADKPLDQGQLLANVGSGTNAISPHVHMSIAVYRDDPRGHKWAKPIAFLDPLDFFHDVPSPRKSASKKTGP